VLHGDADETIPPADAQLLAASLGCPLTVHLFQGATHVFSTPAEGDEVVRVVGGFLSSWPE
jgi:fermentation-respiration switch protein FrsA (DUF1100 family)